MAGALEHRLIGGSAALVRLRSQLRGLAALSFPVLLVGEPGAGRRHAARALHAAGASPGAPLVELDARDALPREALPARGTVLLADVDHLPRDAQTYWGRLARGRALGPRLVATASPSFALRTASDGFDPDLLAALLRFAVHVAPLRQRRSDVAELARHFTAEVGRELGRPQQRLSDAALETLRAAPWFGNVAELRRVIDRTLAFSAAEVIGSEEVAVVLGEVRPSVAVLRERHRLEERESLLRALGDHGGNIARAAQALGRSRAALYRLADKHGIALQRQRAPRAGV